MKTSYYQSIAEKGERKPLNFQIHPPSEKYLEKYEKKKKSIRNRKVEQFESEHHIYVILTYVMNIFIS
jgi:hypothetical protein